MGMEKGRKKLLNITIIILIGIMLVFSKKDNQDKFIGFVEGIGRSNDKFDKESTISMEDGRVEDFTLYDGGALVWQGNKLIKFKMDGSKEWERIFAIDELGVSFGQEDIYIYDKEIGEIHFLNSKGETIKKVYLETNIKNVVEDLTNIIVHVNNSEKEGVIILDQEGDLAGKNMVEDKSILTYSWGKEGKLYALSVLDLTGEDLGSQVKVFKLDGQLLFHIPISNEIIVYSKFISKDKLLIMSDEGLYCIEEDEILWNKKLKSIKDIHVDGEKINILYGDRLDYISFDGEDLGHRSFSEEYNKIDSYNKGLILYGNDYIMGLKGDKEIFKYKGEDEILKVDGVRGKLFVNYKDRIDILSN